jgi:hypothetical protein
MPETRVDSYAPDGLIEIAGHDLDQLALLVALGFDLEDAGDPVTVLARLPVGWMVRVAYGPGDHVEPCGTIFDRWGRRRIAQMAREREVRWPDGHSEQLGPFLAVSRRYTTCWVSEAGDPLGRGRWAIADDGFPLASGRQHLAWQSAVFVREDPNRLWEVSLRASKLILESRWPRHTDPLAYWEDG